MHRTASFEESLCTQITREQVVCSCARIPLPDNHQLLAAYSLHLHREAGPSLQCGKVLSAAVCPCSDGNLITCTCAGVQRHEQQLAAQLAAAEARAAAAEAAAAALHRQLAARDRQLAAAQAQAAALQQSLQQ